MRHSLFAPSNNSAAITHNEDAATVGGDYLPRSVRRDDVVRAGKPLEPSPVLVQLLDHVNELIVKERPERRFG